MVVYIACSQADSVHHLSNIIAPRRASLPGVHALFPTAAPAIAPRVAICCSLTAPPLQWPANLYREEAAAPPPLPPVGTIVHSQGPSIFGPAFAPTCEISISTSRNFVRLARERCPESDFHRDATFKIYQSCKRRNIANLVAANP